MANDSFTAKEDACELEKQQAQQAGIDISEEIAIIQQVEGIMADRIDPMQDYLRERVDV